jgi:NAD(P) transhydrogenase beta subunit
VGHLDDARSVARWTLRLLAHRHRALTAEIAAIGANDVTNPAARRPNTPISGMPILDVDKANNIIVVKRSMGHGYAGIDNELYANPKTGMLFADAKRGLSDITLGSSCWWPSDAAPLDSRA